MNEEFLWSQKYRPKTIDECVLPESIKSVFKDYIASGQIPNFLFNGGPGIGKTTAAFALCEEIGADCLFINASNENGVDTIRTKITQFASNRSFDGNLKVVILDEADRGSAAFQDCLKSFIETHSKTTRFILTTNVKGKIIEPLHSRCTPIDFVVKKEDLQHLQSRMYKRILTILNAENIKYDKAVVAEFVKKFFPDNRRMINELQRYSTSGVIDIGILASFSEDSIAELIGYMKHKKLKDMRTWVANNGADEPTLLYKELYDRLFTMLEPKSIPEAILILGEHTRHSTQVIDHEINNMACLLTLSSSCNFI